MMKRLYILFYAVAALLAGYTVAAAAEGLSMPGDIVYSEPVKSVIYSHKVHVEEKGLTCDNCHPRIFEPKAYTAQKNGDFNMESFYVGKYCGTCHNGKVAFAANTQCARCHMGVTGFDEFKKKGEIEVKTARGPEPALILGSGDSAAQFTHGVHSSFECRECHASLFVMKRGADVITMAAIYQGKFCGACHNGQKAFAAYDCGKCHMNKASVGKGGPKETISFGSADSLAEFKHAAHTAKLACTECHPKIFPMSKAKLGMTMDKINVGKFCGTCHNGKKAFASDDCGKCHPKMR